MQTEIFEQLRQLSIELNLSFEPQDWGIINASAERVEEFMNYLDEKETLQNKIKYHVFELIVASFNEYLLEETCTEKLKTHFIELLARNAENETLQPIINYWKHLNGTDYPVSRFL